MQVIDVARPFGSTRTLGQALTSLLGAVLLATLVPVAILAVGTPVAPAVRAVLEVVQWLFAFGR